MSQIANTIIELMPVTGGAIGATIGQALEVHAQRHVAENQTALVGEWDDVLEQAPVPTGRVRRFSQSLGAALIATGALGFGFVGYALEPSGAEGTAPYVAVAINQAAGTSEAIAGTPTAKVIAEAAHAFGDTDADADAYIATNFIVDNNTKLGDVDPSKVYGQAPMDEATRAALDRAITIRRRGPKDAPRGSAVALVTSDVLPGDTVALAEKAKAAGVPVNVINTYSKNKDAASALRKLAIDTQGHYTEATEKTDLHKAADQVVGDLNANMGNADKGYDPDWEVAGVVTLATLGWLRSIHKRRAEMTNG